MNTVTSKNSSREKQNAHWFLPLFMKDCKQNSERPLKVFHQSVT